MYFEICIGKMMYSQNFCCNLSQNFYYNCVVKIIFSKFKISTIYNAAIFCK